MSPWHWLKKRPSVADEPNTKGVSEFYSNLTLIKRCVTGKLRAARNPIRSGFVVEPGFPRGMIYP